MRLATRHHLARQRRYASAPPKARLLQWSDKWNMYHDNDDYDYEEYSNNKDIAYTYANNHPDEEW